MIVQELTKQKPFENLTTPYQILYSLVIFNYLTRSSLLLLPEDSKLIYKVLTSLENRELIKKHSIQVPRGKEKSNIVYYSITNKGLSYLARNTKEKIERTDAEWLKHIPEVTRLRVSSDGRSDDKFVRYLQVSGTALMAYCAGISTAPLFVNDNTGMFEKNDEEYDELDLDIDLDVNGKAKPETMLRRLVRNALEREYGEEQKQNPSGQINLLNRSPIKFINSYEIKKDRILNSKKSESGSYKRHRYTGIIESPLKSVLVYTGQKKTLGWTMEGMQSEARAFLGYTSSSGTYKGNVGLEEYEGVFIVENAKMFTDSFLAGIRRSEREEKYIRREIEDEDIPLSATSRRIINSKLLGNGFTHFYILPKTHEGVLQLSMLMQVDLPSRRRAIEGNLIKQGYQESSGEQLPRLFRLKDQNGIPSMVSEYIDLNAVNSIYQYYEKQKRKYKIICYKWQQDFYKRILPSAGFEDIEKENYLTYI